MQNQNSRREFVEICSEFRHGPRGVQSPGAPRVYAAERSTAAQSYKLAVPNGSRILVAYASRCGSTAEIGRSRDLRNWPAIHAWGSNVFAAGGKS